MSMELWYHFLRERLSFDPFMYFLIRLVLVMNRIRHKQKKFDLAFQDQDQFCNCFLILITSYDGFNI